MPTQACHSSSKMHKLLHGINNPKADASVETIQISVSPDSLAGDQPGPCRRGSPQVIPSGNLFEGQLDRRCLRQIQHVKVAIAMYVLWPSLCSGHIAEHLHQEEATSPTIWSRLFLFVRCGSSMRVFFVQENHHQEASIPEFASWALEANESRHTSNTCEPSFRSDSLSRGEYDDTDMWRSENQCSECKRWTRLQKQK